MRKAWWWWLYVQIWRNVWRSVLDVSSSQNLSISKASTPPGFSFGSEQVPLQVLKKLRGGRHQQRDLSRCYTASIIQCSLRQCPTNLPQTFPTISNLKQKQQPNLRDSTLQTWASLASDQQQAEEKCSRASMQIEISGWQYQNKADSVDIMLIHSLIHAYSVDISSWI